MLFFILPCEFVLRSYLVAKVGKEKVHELFGRKMK